MTGPKYTTQISLGNVIQITILIGSLLLAGVMVRAQTETNAKAADTNSKSVNGVRVAQSALESRVRSLEVRDAQGAARLEGVQDDLDEIKGDLKANNSLLRQLLRRDTGRISP